MREVVLHRVMPVLIVTSLLLASCVLPPLPAPSPAEVLIQPEASYRPEFEETECPFALPPDEVEGETVQCGFIIVPEDRSQPDGETIRIAVARFKSRAGQPQPDPVMLLSGGPGEKTVASALNASLILAPFRDQRDLIVFDQRGVGLSEPALECPEMLDALYDNLDEGDEEIAARRLFDAITACGARLDAEGVNLAAYNTTENAADVADIASALGYEQVNIYGGSYGSLLAQAVMRDHPEILRSVMIGALFPTSESFFLAAPLNTSNAALHLLESCADDAACAAVYPNLAQDLFGVIAQLNEEPAPVVLTNPQDGQSHDALLTGDAVFANLISFLYFSEIIPILPQAISDVAAGDYELMTRLSSQRLVLFDALSRGMTFSVLCAEDLIGKTPADYLAIRDQIPPALAGRSDPEIELAYGIFGICENWPVDEADPAIKQPVTSDVPALLLEGEFDPVTPSAFAEKVADTLDNAYLYEFPGIGHNVMVASRCAQDIARQFVEDPTTAPDASCIDEMPGVAFDLPQEPTGEIVLEPVSSEASGLSGVAPAGWERVGEGTFLRGQNALDSAALVIDVLDMAESDVLQLLAARLRLDAPPEALEQRSGDHFDWTLYAEEVQGVAVEFAVTARKDGSSLLVLLQAPAEERDALVEAVLLPVLDALAPLEAADAGAGGEAAPESVSPAPAGEAEATATYDEPGGLFSVPIPTNWTVEEGAGFALLRSPDAMIEAYVLALEADDIEAAIAEAWQLVDPAFDLPVDEVIDEPNKPGVARTVTLTYDSGDDEELVVIAAGWLVDGVAYLELFRSDLESFQKRASQLQIISTGYKIHALEETDLSGAAMKPLDDALLAEFEGYVAEKLEELDVPGAAIAIVQNGDLVYAEGFGVRDLESQEPVTPDTLMMIGSTTKSMTTMLMAQLVDQGAFQWDTPVVRIWPDFRVADPGLTEQITMRNLVCACTGVPRRDLEWTFNASTLTAEDVLRSLADFEFFTDFGEAFQYSNQMVASAGYLAALAAGGEFGDLYDSYVALMQASIFDPIGMDRATFDFAEVTAGGAYATPYGQAPTGEMIELPLSTEAILVPVGPAGALWANVLDMARYVQTQLAGGVAPDGTPVVSAENLAVTWEPQVDITADASYGLGWIIEDYDGVPVISHGGNTFGFTSELAFLPEHDLGISILTNQQGSMFNQIVRYRLLELLFGREPQVEGQMQFALEMIDKNRAELRETLQDSIDEAAIEPFLGDYRHEALGEATLAWQDDQLILDVGEFQIEIRARENDDGEIVYLTFTPPVVGMPVEFELDEAGKPTIVFGMGVVRYVFERS